MNEVDMKLIKLELDRSQGRISGKDYVKLLGELCTEHGTEYIGSRMIALDLL